MNEDKILRVQLQSLLKGGNAHMTFLEAVADFPIDKINVKFTNGKYTFWHLLEHIRRAQNDILEFIINPKYEDKEWPKDYWPLIGEEATEKDWYNTIENFKKDQEKLKDIIENKNTDFFKEIPWGDGQTVLREIQLVADHNAYHIGEFAIMRQVLGTWGINHN